MNAYRSLLRAVGASAVLAAMALPATAQTYPAPGGYSYPAPSYSPPGAYPTPGSYPPPATYPAPGGYPAPSYPVPSGYPAPGSYQPQYSSPQPAGSYPSAANATTFVCGRSGSDPATLVQAGGRLLRSPLIVWSTHYFGPESTPEQRCQEVSARLTAAVAQNGGRLSNLRLSTGYVNGQAVICFLNNSASCDQFNMLFTLKPENARNAPGVLARLANFGRYGGGNSIRESGGLGGSGSTSGAGSSVSLEDAINQAIQAEGGLAPNPGSPVGPVYQPAPSSPSDYSGGGGI